MTNEQPPVNLHATMDAKVWADEFCRLNNASDAGMMLGWFANAIMVGYDHGKRESAALASKVVQEPTCQHKRTYERASDYYHPARTFCLDCGETLDAAPLAAGEPDSVHVTERSGEAATGREDGGGVALPATGQEKNDAS